MQGGRPGAAQGPVKGCDTDLAGRRPFLWVTVGEAQEGRSESKRADVWAAQATVLMSDDWGIRVSFLFSPGSFPS